MTFPVILVFIFQIEIIFCTEKLTSMNFNVNGNQIFVFDNLLLPNVGKVFNQYLKINRYSYHYPDPYEQQNHNQVEGNLYWKSPMNPSILVKTRFWKYIRDAYKSLPYDITYDKRFLPYVAYGTVLQRGDHPIAFRGDEDTNGKIFARVFLTPGLGKDAYNDQIFYNNDDEIAVSIFPKVNRIVLWTGDVQTLFHPPMSFLNHEYSFFMKLTNDKELFQKRSVQFTEEEEEQHVFKQQPFPLTNMINKFDFGNINISNNILGKYYDRNGDVVAFFDNIFSQEMLTALRSYFLSYKGLFHDTEYDTSLDETNYNVRWIAALKPEEVLNTPYIEWIKKLATFLSNHTGWYPYDVSCNLIQHTHHTRIHTDCTIDEYEYTFLLYLNPNWNENMYAETTFYEYNAETLKEIEEEGWNVIDDKGKENYEFLTGVVPKYGRVALFRNLIPHSARPPAPSFLGAHYTFPVKISKTKFHARAKILRELLEFDTEQSNSKPDLEVLLVDGNYEPFLGDGKIGFVEKNIQRSRDHIDTRRNQYKEAIVNLLFPKNLKPASST